MIIGLFACKNGKKEPKAVDVVESPEKIDKSVNENIAELMAFATEKNGKLDDTLSVNYLKALNDFYATRDNMPFWSSKENWQPYTQTILSFLDTSAYQGLLKEAYSYTEIVQTKSALDSSAENRKDAVRWAKADILLTAAFIGIVQDLKQGRLISDSQKFANKPANYRSLFQPAFKAAEDGKAIHFFEKLQPGLADYVALRSSIKSFADSMDTKEYTYLIYPYKDSMQFLRNLKKRFAESGIAVPKGNFDSVSLANSIAAYQKKRKIRVDSTVTTTLVRSLNYNDMEKLKRIFITLDKYKALPEKLPAKYIWVNIPSFYLRVFENDTVKILSRVIVGTPGTPTPQLYSQISDMVLNPTWTVPASIIKKEMLPGLKRNPNYLARRGLYLLNIKGERVDPYSVDWSKYTNGIPYRVQQGSGDNNALGVIKFNFKNSHQVYLHDTNVRRLFKNSNRSLSHGCVRVQEWQALSNFIAINDSLNLKPADTLRYTRDSINTWLAEGGYRMVPVTNQIPLYIKYFTCEGKDGKMVFHDDIYGEDRRLRERFFSIKK